MSKATTKEQKQGGGNGAEMRHLGFIYGIMQKALDGQITAGDALQMIRASFEIKQD